MKWIVALILAALLACLWLPKSDGEYLLHYGPQVVLVALAVIWFSVAFLLWRYGVIP